MRPLKTLLVEDHADSAQALARLLRLEGHSVTTATSFADAVAVASKLPSIDLLISDIVLSDGNGCALLRLLRERPDGGPRRAVAMSGLSDGHLADECRRAGYHRFLLKPVVFPELVATVAALYVADTLLPSATSQPFV